MSINMQSLLPGGPVADLARLHGGDDCPLCRRAASRLHEAEAASDGLRRDLELGARRLRLVMGQLARSEERRVGKECCR